MAATFDEPYQASPSCCTNLAVILAALKPSVARVAVQSRKAILLFS